MNSSKYSSRAWSLRSGSVTGVCLETGPILGFVFLLDFTLAKAFLPVTTFFSLEAGEAFGFVAGFFLTTVDFFLFINLVLAIRCGHFYLFLSLSKFSLFLLSF